MKLETSVELLERLRVKHGSSWYGLGRLLEVHENTITNWKGGRTIVDRKFAPRIAELLGESPEYVLLCLEHEREPSPEVRKIWRRLAGLITHTAASLLLCAVAIGPLLGALARSTYYGKSRRGSGRGFLTWLARPLGPLPPPPQSVTAPAF